MSTKDHGRICWYDLKTTDVEAAKKFYGSLLGWRIEPVDMGDPQYFMIFMGDRALGGALELKGDNVPAHWIPYFAVDDVEKSAGQAETLGARVLVPPTDIGPGIFSMVNDPQGGPFSLWKSKDPLPEPPTKGEVGVFCWAECMTTDPAASQAFYEGLFGWRTETADMEIGGKPLTYRLLFLGDGHFGGILQLPAEARAQGAKTHWLNYVNVVEANVDAAAARAVELGARVLLPCTDIPQGGRFCVIQDPQGAVLALFKDEAA
jgi:uncharacterized protein